jgi:signal transduction histidine kinase
MYTRQQASLAELSQLVLVGTDLPTLMSRAVTFIAHTLNVEYSHILELLPEQSAFAVRACAGCQEGCLEQLVMEGDRTTSLASYTLHNDTVVIVDDWRTETRFSQPPLLRNKSVSSSLHTAIRTPDRLFGVLGADSTSRRTCTSDDVHFLQAVANMLALAIDRVEAKQLLEQRVEARTREIERRHQFADSLHEMLTILNSNHTLDEILDYTLAQACRLLGAAGAIYHLDSQSALLNIRAAYGLDADDAALQIPAAWSVVEQAVLKRQPVILSDTITCPPDQDNRLPPLQMQSARRVPASRYRAQLAVPLIVKADVYGAIVLYYREPREFSDAEVRFATALSDQAALAIANARLVAASQGKAILEERQRLARDLHDSVAQALYSVILHAEAGTRLLASGDDATVADYLREMQSTAQEALTEMRLLIFELRPPVLDQEGLVAALRMRLEAVEGRANLQTEFTVEGVSKLAPFVEQALYRIAQEALNNALKHAHARRITVLLQQVQTRVRLEISDDGIGFDPVTVHDKGGLGLLGIEERVAQLGGRLMLQSVPGAGTQLRVEIGL